METPENLLPLLHCARCFKQVRADRMVKGFGRDCATFLGLVGTAPDIGHDGPDLLDILAGHHPPGHDLPHD